jgi:putative toxin-antitoxin system antitoxin component (TIGR02293 family)
MHLINPGEIAEVLNLREKPQTISELDMLVSHGLPKESLRFAVDQVYSKPEDRTRLMCLIVPEATFKRRRDRLSAEESARTERLARVIATAKYVCGDELGAREFLIGQHALLNGRKPVDAAMTELGALEVTQLLWRLFYGVAV